MILCGVGGWVCVCGWGVEGGGGGDGKGGESGGKRKKKRKEKSGYVH